MQICLCRYQRKEDSEREIGLCVCCGVHEGEVIIVDLEGKPVPTPIVGYWPMDHFKLNLFPLIEAQSWVPMTINVGEDVYEALLAHARYSFAPIDFNHSQLTLGEQKIIDREVLAKIKNLCNKK